MGNIFSTSCCTPNNHDEYKDLTDQSRESDDGEANEVDGITTNSEYTHLAEETIEPVVNSLVTAVAQVIISLEEQFLDFPFLKDEKTISYIKTSKTMFIMRGVPGSGKSTIARALQQVYPSAVICSADNYFMKENQYNYRADDLGSAHKFCQEKSVEAVKNDTNVIVIDNTNVKRWEMKFYLDLARQQLYRVVLVQPHTDWKDDPKVLASRNSHDVDETTIRKKIKAFEEYVPFYYAWFLNKENSAMVYNKCYETLTHCVENVPNFCSFVLGNVFSTREFLEYFKLVEIPDTVYHCTSKFLGGPKSGIMRRLDYHNSKHVQAAYGKSFPILMTGMIVTSSVVAVRIKLPSEESLQLIDKPEENSDGWFQSKVRHQKGSSAHLTIATADGVLAKHSNTDLLAICEMEKTGSVSAPPHKLSFGLVNFWDRYCCSISFDEHVEMNSLFCGS